MSTNQIPFKTEIVQVTNNLSIQFLYVPEDSRVTKFEMEGHEIFFIGRLKQFNRIKYLKKWRNKYGDLVKLFTKALSNRGWNFTEFPNPVAFFLLES